MTDVSRTKKLAANAATHAKNAAVVAKGKTKTKAGKVMGDRRLETQGKLETAKGRVKQVGQKLKETLDD